MVKTRAYDNQTLAGSAIVLPFTVTLPDGPTLPNTLTCEKLLRHLPGKRLACLARWGEREVFAKFFIDPNNAKRDWLRDANGAHALLDRGILAPTILYSGPILIPLGEPTPYNGYLLIFDRITPALTLLDVWNRTDEHTQLGLLRSLVTVLAHHHRTGLVHGDLHFANFMVQGENIFTLDGGQINISDIPIAKARSMRNLGLLFAELPPQYNRYIDEVFPGYMILRDWREEPADKHKLLACIHSAREHRKDKFLKKIFRECSAFVCRRQMRSFAVYDREYDSTQLRQLLNDPDSFLKSASCQIIKSGNTATLGIVEIDGRKLVIKRYNIKNFWHACRRALRSTRAANCWRNAHLLRLYDINTLVPVALLEMRFGMLRSTSYFISRYIEGPDCARYFSIQTRESIDRTAMVKKFSQLFDKLAEAKISHGDLKATNIIISEEQPVLLDLDAVCQHRSEVNFKKAFTRDRQRFLKNWDKNAAVRHLFEAHLPTFIYGQKAPLG